MRNSYYNKSYNLSVKGKIKRTGIYVLDHIKREIKDA